MKIWTIGLIMMATLTMSGIVEGAFSSTYVPSNYFDKVRMEGTLPLGTHISWDSLTYDDSTLILSKEVWYKQYDNTGDSIGIIFVTKTQDTSTVIGQLTAEMTVKGVTNIEAKKYEVPTIELTYSGMDFTLYLQNQGEGTQDFKIEITNGKEFVINTLEEVYHVPINTIGNQFPVILKLGVPQGLPVGEFKDFTYTVTELHPQATDGTITPTVPFIKNYKILVVDKDAPKGLEIVYPKLNNTAKGKFKIQWTPVEEQNFKRYVISVSNNSAYSGGEITIANNINEVTHEITLPTDGTYYLKVRAEDQFNNFAEKEITFSYKKFNIINQYTIAGVLVIIILVVFGMMYFNNKKVETTNE